MKCKLMHKTIPVISFECDDVSGTITKLYDVYNENHLPVCVMHTNDVIDRHDLNRWWMSRAIPMSRDGLTDILHALEINAATPLITKNYGLSLSDQYWICPEDMNISWDKVNFFDNSFSEDFGDVLMGLKGNTDDIDFMSPDITSGGWLKKKWKIVQEELVLLKGGSKPFRQEPFGEVFASMVMEQLGIPCVHYSLTTIDDKPYSVCKDFINKDTELVTAYEITESKKKPNHVSIYNHYVDCCKERGIDNIQDFLDKMITLDFIILNEDRHLNNFGLIRNANTLEYISPAPIYDSGSSLWFNFSDMRIKADTKDITCKPFKNSHSEQIKLVSSFDWLDFSKLKHIDEELSEILKKSEYITNERRDKICGALSERIDILEGVAKQKVKYTPVHSTENDVTKDVAYSGHTYLNGKPMPKPVPENNPDDEDEPNY